MESWRKSRENARPQTVAELQPEIEKKSWRERLAEREKEEEERKIKAEEERKAKAAQRASEAAAAPPPPKVSENLDKCERGNKITPLWYKCQVKCSIMLECVLQRSKREYEF